MVETLSLIVDEKEELVFPNWPAEGATEHVPTQSLPGQIIARTVEFVLPLVGIENIIAEEFPDITVVLIGPRLDGSVDDTAGEIAELCGSVGSDQVEFLNGVRGRCETQVVFGRLIV